MSLVQQITLLPEPQFSLKLFSNEKRHTASVRLILQHSANGGRGAEGSPS